VHKVEIHALGFVLHTLQLHRHRAAEVVEHSHPFEQLILFVSGEGWQKLGDHWLPARAGDLFLIPRGVTHGFGGARPPRPLGRNASGSPTRSRSWPPTGRASPISLVLDYEVKPTSKRPRPQHRHLSPAVLDDLRRELARIPTKGKLGLADYPAVLEVIARLLEPRPAQLAGSKPEAWARAAHQRVREPGSLAEVARKAGYHRDHLTRKLKRSEGLGLRALRDRYRLEAAQAALHNAATVGDAAAAAGFDDANYFARWFRRRTGETPSQYKR
jgi:AraC family transcriptional activator of pobA